MIYMPNWKDFWSASRWGDVWGVRRWINGKFTNPHRGHDIRPSVRGRKDSIPALRAGTVDFLAFSTVLGYVMVIRVNSNTYDYYCHLEQGTYPAVGTAVRQGHIVGVMANANERPGSAWNGVHLHYGSGPNRRSVFEGPTYNATNIITDTVSIIPAGPGAGNTIPEFEPEPVEELDENMKYRMITYTNPTGRRWAICHPVNLVAGFEETADPNTARHWQNSLDVYDVWGSGTWDEYARVRAEAGAWRTKYLAAKAQE